MAASWLLGRAVTRKFSTAVSGSPQTQHGESWKLWRAITLFGAFPAIAVCMVNTYLKHQEEHHHPRPPFVKYDYLCIRTKAYPWGDGQRTLFHNPKKNPLPTGEFEEE
ncbi:cytochrome c oxidase subunit 6A1, mitochondrial [Cephus cinctus]|uniref:Cytochrome c oxidase subunit 6A1, mitochondrial n=1 Tax=Cephus cinctus TaxID=211228 RepID=A0AAJ7FL89_CEPCN|nr:cytochrome c oxidase subunit 6A1, mitochondrial [Cephus cinctus]